MVCNCGKHTLINSCLWIISNYMVCNCGEHKQWSVSMQLLSSEVWSLWIISNYKVCNCGKHKHCSDQWVCNYWVVKSGACEL